MNKKYKNLTTYFLMLVMITLPLLKLSIQIAVDKCTQHVAHYSDAKTTNNQNDTSHHDSVLKKGICVNYQLNAIFSSYLISDVPMLLCGVLFMILLPIGLSPIYRIYKPPRFSPSNA